ncbi:MAG: flagellar hook-associated protein FlgL [bacterium]
MYRVSTGQIYSANNKSISDYTVGLNRLNRKISTGKEVDKVSDDPVIKQKIMREDKVLIRNSMYKKNTDDARMQLQTAEVSLGKVSDILNSLKSLTLHMSNDTVNEEDREQAREEVLQSMEDMLDLANTSVNGFHIFAGHSVSQEPFEEDGTYNGDENVREMEIAPGTKVPVAFTGNEVFTGMSGGTPEGVDIFQTCIDLAEDLLNNDGESIQERLEDIDSSIEQVNTARTDAGMRLRKVEMTASFLNNAETEHTIYKSDMEDIDIAKTAIEFESMKASLQASMSVTAKVFEVSLLNYMR